MKLCIAVLLLCFACGCATDEDYFKTKNGRGPYIPRYLHFLPAQKSQEKTKKKETKPSYNQPLSSQY